MIVGFANIYSYRPHGHHAHFLSMLFKKLGYSTSSIDCRSAPSHCYVREYKGVGLSECFKCAAGGLNSFQFDRRQSFGEYWGKEADVDTRDWVLSSAYTLTRIESDADRNSDDVQNKVKLLDSNAAKIYCATKDWIRENSIECLVLFNGRMDYTRAVMEACIDLGVNCLTHERPLFGNGVIVNLNKNCSSLSNIHRINAKYKDKPLTERQLRIASFIAAQRLIGFNKMEWRLYNEYPTSVAQWPNASSKRKILICPSSKNELLGHPDWDTPWKNNTDAIDYAVSKGLFDYTDLVVRFHPAWSVSFGVVAGDKCSDHYKQWCESRGVYFFPSDDKVNTKDLIKLADLVVLNGSNTIFEVGALGKSALCLGPSSYTYSGVAVDCLSYHDLDSLDINALCNRSSGDIVRKTLRFIYNKAAREPLFVDHVRSKSVTECDFYEGADPYIIKALLVSDVAVENDSDFSSSEAFEDYFIEGFLNRDLNRLQVFAAWKWEVDSSDKLTVSRRGAYKLIDYVRNLSPKGV